MERLSLDDDSQYSAVEAAIHLARYAVAASYCQGARVLDIACGEGYGARFLASQGAAEVVGVDADKATVDRAISRYGSEHVSFHCARAERVDELLDADSFDLVVSLETIEHLSAPERFLRVLRKVARPSAVLIVSCPNDHWYFPDAAEQNPYHIRKYSYKEFRQMSEAVLGSAGQWLLGGPTMGFGTMPIGKEANTRRERTQRRMHECVALQAAFAIPAEEGLEPSTLNSSYFVGIWGGGAPRCEHQCGTMVAYPLSMDAFHPAFQVAHCRQLDTRNKQLEAHVASLEGELARLHRFRSYLPNWIVRPLSQLAGRHKAGRRQ